MSKAAPGTASATSKSILQRPAEATPVQCRPARPPNFSNDRSVSVGNIANLPSNFRKLPNVFPKPPTYFSKPVDDFQKPPGKFQKSPNDLHKAPNKFQESPGEFHKTPSDFLKWPNDFHKPPNDFPKALGDFLEPPDDMSIWEVVEPDEKVAEPFCQGDECFWEVESPIRLVGFLIREGVRLILPDVAVVGVLWTNLKRGLSQTAWPWEG